MSGNIPKNISLDSSLSLLREGYLFIQNRCQRLKTDIFETRLLGEHVICMYGEEAAKVFYDNNHFKRNGAAPKRILKSLFGEKGVQTLDQSEHKHRKEMFMSLMTSDRLSILNELTNEEWKVKSRDFENKNTVVLFDETQEIMCKVALRWAGVPFDDFEIKSLANDFGMMIDAFGAVGVRHYKGRIARVKTELWMKNIIEQVRNHKLKQANETALYVIANHRDLNGNLLDLQVAAVELMNIIRPIVAIATYITFGALAIHEQPDCLKKVQENQNNYLEMFVEEIRRYYPFAPFVGARVSEGFTWNNYNFKKGTLVLLDIYGTNHDHRLWEKVDEFWPERFVNWSGNRYAFIPQGGGEYLEGHRCAGEMVTIEIMKSSLDFIVNHLVYEVPNQDLSYSMSRIPTLPKSRFIINNVKRK
ncbi:MAG: cytochrome [Haloplasmataceae bacterium]|jgi:fatty-acid peroxygenase|nr:cytochrome [Haloplasmataceae bacterium]